MLRLETYGIPLAAYRETPAGIRLFLRFRVRAFLRPRRLSICLIAFVLSISTIREVVLIPNRHWGGEGLLGCVFGCVHLTTV